MILIAREEKIKLMPGDIRPNLLVELEVKDDDYEGKYPSRVEEVREDSLVLAMPISRGEIVTLRKDTPITVNFMRDGANHAFNATILERIRDPLPVFIVKMPLEARKKQRREWVRVPASLEFSYSLMKDKSNLDLDFLEALTVDLSGGGLMFYGNRGYRPGERMKIILHLPKRPLELEAKVVRSAVIPDQMPRLYQIGVEFTSVKERQRDRIMNYVFEQQRRLIKKGLM